MIHWLKKHFIPHEGNNHHPHILRTKNIQNIVIAVLFLEIFTFLLPTLSHINMRGGMAAVLPAVLSNLTNEERKDQNLKTLTVNPTLNKAAKMKAEDMATKSYFAHTSPEGKTPWYWIEQVGYDYQYAGENLAINFSDSKDVTNAWMTSPTHKENIVKENYTEIGTGVSTGIYNGKETVFVAQIYANPLVKEEKDLQVTSKIEPKKKVSPKIINTGKETPNILGAETVATTESNIAVKNPTFLQKLIASPHNTSNIILYIIFGIITISLLLYIFIKARNHYMRLITNGLIALVIIGAIFITNYYISNQNTIITQNIDYSRENI